jgi:hypothetical protein
VSDPADTPGLDAVYPCVGICLPDSDEAYCIGCGRPWGEPVVLPQKPGTPATSQPPKPDDPVTGDKRHTLP